MTAEPTPDPTPTPEPDPTPDPQPEPTPDGDGDGKGGKTAILADLAAERDKRQALEKQVTDLQAAQQQQLDGIAKALGLKPEDTPPDPAKLTEQLTTEQAKAREAAVQLAVYRNATAGGANPDALLDSASFLRSLADVDPNDTAAVTTAIKAAVQANARLAASDFPSAGQAGIGVGGGGGQPTDPKSADLAQIEADLRAAKRH